VRARMKDNAGRWSHWSAPLQFSTGNPMVLETLRTNLVITEVLYDPAPSSAAESALGYESADFEFVELWNRGASALDLSNVRLTKGVDFDFAGGSITRLDPGAYLVVVRNQQAFILRYGTNLPVAGDYGNKAEGKLDNNGETIKLSFGNGVAIHEFRYENAAPWPVNSAKAGFSINLRHPLESPASLNDGANWVLSSLAGGTPGRPDDPLATWKTRYFDPLDGHFAQLSALDADPDFDGLINLWEYAFGTHPRLPDSVRRPRAFLTHQSGQDYLTLTYPRRALTDNLDFGVQTSDDLIHWTTSTNWVHETLAGSLDAEGVEWIACHQAIPVTGRSMSFVRLVLHLH
jgi:hypothetical protein